MFAVTLDLRPPISITAFIVVEPEAYRPGFVVGPSVVLVLTFMLFHIPPSELRGCQSARFMHYRAIAL